MNTEYRELHEKLARRQLAATLGAAVVNTAMQAAQLRQAEAHHTAQLEQADENHREMLEAFEERNREVDYLNTLSPEGKVAYGQLKNKAGWDRTEIEYFLGLTSPEDAELYFEQRKIGWAHREAAYFVELSPTDRRAYLEEKEARRLAAEAARLAAAALAAAKEARLKQITARIGLLAGLSVAATWVIGGLALLTLPVLGVAWFIWAAQAYSDLEYAQKAGRNLELELSEKQAGAKKGNGIILLVIVACLFFGIVTRPWDAIYRFQKDNAGAAAPTSEALPTSAPTPVAVATPAPTPEAPAPTPAPTPVASNWSSERVAESGIFKAQPTPEAPAPTPAPTPEAAPVEVATPAPTPEVTAPRATPVIRNSYVPADQLPGYHGEGAANAALRQEVPAPRAISVQDPEVTAPRATSVQDPANFVMSVLRNYNRHDYLALAPYLVSGHTNYFGHREATDAFVRHDMANDVRTYAEVKCTFQPETFTHEVSNEYSRHWEGPMVYDSITAYTEAREFNGKVHSATTRFTVGYTSVNGVTKIYAMVDKVL